MTVLALWYILSHTKSTEWFYPRLFLSYIPFTKCFGTCQFLRGLWMGISAACVAIRMRTDANNLVTTASTTRLPEQKETIHMIQMLRKESCSGQTDDLAHVSSADCLSDCLTTYFSETRCIIQGSVIKYPSEPTHASSVQVLVEAQGILINMASYHYWSSSTLCQFHWKIPLSVIC